MALESAPGSALGRIDPSSLVGLATPVVEPRATAALAEAFRSGMINANDIHDRVSERAKSKEKMEITLANRATAEAEDPALIEARRQQMLAGGAQGSLAIDQAQAAQGLLPDQVAAQRAAMENAAGLQRYPAAAIFDKYAPEVGLEVPMTADGKVDFAKKAALGAKMASWATRREQAREAYKNIDSKTSADGTILFAVTKQGQPVSPDEVRKLHLAGQEPFLIDAQPGQVVSPAVATTPAVAPSVSPSISVEPAGAAPTPAPITVEPRQAAPGVPPVGTRVDQGFSLGAPRVTGTDAEAPIKMTGEQASSIARGTFTSDIFSNLKANYANLVKESPNLTGPIMGRLAPLIFAGSWDPALAGFASDQAAILAPLVKGIFQETGVLSEKDIQRYTPTLPQTTDTPAVASVKIDKLERNIHDSIIRNVDAMVAQGQVLKPGALEIYKNSVAELNRPEGKPAAAPTTTATAAAKPAPVQTTSTGRKFQKDASGNYVPVP